MSDHLYIHIPFCLKKCRYCDFYSLETRKIPQAFILALVREIRIRSGICPLSGPVKTLYFGGGTPSLLSLKDLETLFEAIHDRFSVTPDAEITLEANPGTVSPAYLKAVRGLGINRLSLGIQSFNPGKLALLGRIHTQEQGMAAIDGARSAGFDNLGLDLIFGVPGETERFWETEMETALAHAPEHLSCYMLSVEQGTPLYRQQQAGKFVSMVRDAQVNRFSATSLFLKQAGYDHYEISNFALGPGNRSRHNSAYWQMKPYAGFGPSAHSLFLDPRTGPVRSWNLADLTQYIRHLGQGQLPVAEAETLSPGQELAEGVMVGLRTREGMDLVRFDTLSPIPFVQRFDRLIRNIQDQGLGSLDRSGRRFFLTLEGWACLDSIVESFTQDLL